MISFYFSLSIKFSYSLVSVSMPFLQLDWNLCPPEVFRVHSAVSPLPTYPEGFLGKGEAFSVVGEKEMAMYFQWSQLKYACFCWCTSSSENFCLRSNGKSKRCRSKHAKDRCFSLSKRSLVALCDSDDIKIPFTWFLMKASSTHFTSTRREELSCFFYPVYSQGNTTALYWGLTLHFCLIRAILMLVMHNITTALSN